MCIITSSRNHRPYGTLIFTFKIRDPIKKDPILVTVYMNSLNNSDDKSDVSMLFTVNSQVRYIGEVEKNNIKDIYKKIDDLYYPKVRWNNGDMTDGIQYDGFKDNRIKMFKTDNYTTIVSTLKCVDKTLKSYSFPLASDYKDMIIDMKNPSKYPEGDDIYVIMCKSHKKVEHGTIVVFHEIPNSEKIEIPLMHENSLNGYYKYDVVFGLEEVLCKIIDNSNFDKKINLDFNITNIVSGKIISKYPSVLDRFISFLKNYVGIEEDEDNRIKINDISLYSSFLTRKYKEVSNDNYNLFYKATI